MARRPARRANAAPAVEVHIEQPGPTEFTDPFVRRELARASVWLGLALAIIGVIVLAQPLMERSRGRCVGSATVASGSILLRSLNRNAWR